MTMPSFPHPIAYPCARCGSRNYRTDANDPQRCESCGALHVAHAIDHSEMGFIVAISLGVVADTHAPPCPACRYNVQVSRVPNVALAFVIDTLSLFVVENTGLACPVCRTMLPGVTVPGLAPAWEEMAASV
jgi:hypothetical protein